MFLSFGWTVTLLYPVLCNVGGDLTRKLVSGWQCERARPGLLLHEHEEGIGPDGGSGE